MAQVIKNVLILIILAIIIIIPVNIIAQVSFKKRPEVAAVYYPHWHKYDHGIAWNEWTEGSYLLPEERTGTLYLEAIQKVFGVAEKANSNLQGKKSKQKH